MSNKRSIILRGDPEINEQGVATAAIKPGYMVQGVSYLAAQAINDTRRVPAAFALEREELGEGIDDSIQGSGTLTSAYASGDTVKVGVFDAGDRVLGVVASGETVSEDTLLTSNGAGKLKAATTSAFVVGRSLETLGTVAVDTFCTVEII